MLGSPAEVNLASGHSAAHISSIITVPLTAAIRSPTPRIRATPTASRPAMNSQYAQEAPAQAWKVDSKGPTATLLRKPLVGEPPLIQALADGVAYPNPKVLSRNDERNLAAPLVMIVPGAGSVWVARWAGGRSEPSSRFDSWMAMTCLLVGCALVMSVAISPTPAMGRAAPSPRDLWPGRRAARAAASCVAARLGSRVAVVRSDRWVGAAGRLRRAG